MKQCKNEKAVTLKSIGFKEVRMPRMCDNCVYDEGRLYKECTHPIARKVVGKAWRYMCVCKYHKFDKGVKLKCQDPTTK